jgi:hypothetical protein
LFVANTTAFNRAESSRHALYYLISLDDFKIVVPKKIIDDSLWV